MATPTRGYRWRQTACSSAPLRLPGRCVVAPRRWQTLSPKARFARSRSDGRDRQAAAAQAWALGEECRRSPLGSPVRPSATLRWSVAVEFVWRRRVRSGCSATPIGRHHRLQVSPTAALPAKTLRDSRVTRGRSTRKAKSRPLRFWLQRHSGSNVGFRLSCSRVLPSVRTMRTFCWFSPPSRSSAAANRRSTMQ